MPMLYSRICEFGGIHLTEPSPLANRYSSGTLACPTPDLCRPGHNPAATRDPFPWEPQRSH